MANKLKYKNKNRNNHGSSLGWNFTEARGLGQDILLKHNPYSDRLIVDRERETVTLTTDGPRIVLMDSRMNRNYDGCTDVFIISLSLFSHTQKY